MSQIEEKCALCGSLSNLTWHHLVPKVKAKNKYKSIRNDDSNLVRVCRQCHDQIHSLYNESWLRDNLNTLEKLLSDEKLMKFVNWKKKHQDFDGHSKMSKERKMRNNR